MVYGCSDFPFFVKVIFISHADSNRISGFSKCRVQFFRGQIRFFPLSTQTDILTSGFIIQALPSSFPLNLRNRTRLLPPVCSGFLCGFPFSSDFVSITDILQTRDILYRFTLLVRIP